MMILSRRFPLGENGLRLHPRAHGIIAFNYSRQELPIMMKCPHCNFSFHEVWNDIYVDSAKTNKEYPYEYRTWVLRRLHCPECERLVVMFREFDGGYDEEAIPSLGSSKIVKDHPVLPKAILRARLPKDVPDEFSEDYHEACLVLAHSPKASAALSRRCLQHFIREKMKVKASDLSTEIQGALDSGALPSHLAKAIDAVRTVGNFAAHPIKSKSTGEVVEVETGEAEWLLDTLESLFDFFFVQPIELERRRAALDEKLKQAGKPPLKS
jgi:hypothetical protein